MDVRRGQAVIVAAASGCATARAEGAEYIAVCLPAFSPDTVHRDA